MKKKIPEKTIQRLLLYYRYLYFLLQQGTKNISSKSLADLLEIRGSQVRKDLSYFGRLGTRGAGYDVMALRDTIAEILKIDKEKKVCVVGMGNLGAALVAYKGFEALGFKVAAVFDISPQKINHKIRGHTCHDIKNLSKIINEHSIEVAILTVPAEAAQETALRLEKAGIKAILNFTPVKLSLSKKVKINNIDLAMELKTLSFFIR
ncbi:MAG: redox-sensing transcriptional repressor Rex [Candidatus Margulisbacteria bacterium]|nr:redox-sensing transcriptional repressor Rex [Candidatus Margulisiibacteriota bacterium]MBU1022029.1 redox-sensing transcriptional repressor Rex [Candidatus Margulisiibacteriota bacterium]MBU1729624.1 redox-sensing transcriptional repressor Rex [Candidatus Margulisiibacteriota bacterium]MBU1954944.1 redox-sensing transcriptional repressor Rex [Candidatus Margulisiibacteriota bacterium]